ncbi:DMT family transporter [Jatrophihabitans lederbergiae]|uniref:DMT family transporter n=1 Tax=Jatrophihabitans lederbergiae TaxID=3075547 RepID=A0ABU2JHB7_9ACTN|nr:DMT family transporter [Jatrophihabitans sp. DSM 44399]MDT0263884.1 DMT family transporter [Jatrophihabitans sp. DSM 44399]
MSLAVAVGAALGSALGQALSSTMQHRSAIAAPRGSGLRFGLLWHLSRRPAWLAGAGLGGVGFALQAVALGSGTLVVVQPLLVTGLLFAVLAGALADRRLPRPAEWCWSALLVLGLAVFLLAANPAAGTKRADDHLLLSLLVLLGGAAVLAVAGAQRGRPAWAAIWLGVAAGIAHGATAALMKGAVADAAGGPVGVLRHWPLWALIGVSLAATVLTQAAYQAGPLVDSLPVMTMIDTVVAIGLGTLAFSESVAVSMTASGLQVASLTLMAVALVGLTRRPGRDPAAVSS